MHVFFHNQEASVDVIPTSDFWILASVFTIKIFGSAERVHAEHEFDSAELPFLRRGDDGADPFSVLADHLEILKLVALAGQKRETNLGLDRFPFLRRKGMVHGLVIPCIGKNFRHGSFRIAPDAEIDVLTQERQGVKNL
jgi:hypothetical protein